MFEFQKRCLGWAQHAFSYAPKLVTSHRERALRYGEEAIELLQACGLSTADIQNLTAYVYSRPVGEITDEIGGSLVCLAALSSSYDISLEVAGDWAIAKCWDKVDAIRVKHADKPLAIRDKDIAVS